MFSRSILTYLYLSVQQHDAHVGVGVRESRVRGKCKVFVGHALIVTVNRFIPPFGVVYTRCDSGHDFPEFVQRYCHGERPLFVQFGFKKGVIDTYIYSTLINWLYKGDVGLVKGRVGDGRIVVRGYWLWGGGGAVRVEEGVA